MYHYFNDLNELLLETKLSMIRDMMLHSKEQVARSDDPLKYMKDSMRWPVDFFINNPNIFRFFYLYEMDSRNENVMKSLEIEKAYYDNFMPFVEKGVIKKSDIFTISRIITYSVYGMITLYLSSNGLKQEDIYNDIDNIIDILLKGNNGNEEKK